MVVDKESSDGSLQAPLLDDYEEENHHSGSSGRQEDEVVLTVPDESREDFERSVSRQNEKEYSVAPDVTLADPELASGRSAFQQIHDMHGPHSRDYARRGSLPRALSKRERRRLRNPIQKKSFVARAAYSAKTDTWNFLYNVMIGLYMWPKWSWDAMKANSSLTILSLKQGVVAGLASILCVVKFPDPFDEISSIALWAVVTTDLLYEGNIGLSVSKGFNRVLGTLAAGCLGVMLNQLGPLLGDVGYACYVVVCVMVGGAVFRFLKGIPPLKDQWGYAFTVATIAFHLFIVTAYLDPERWTLPMLRFSMILLGFALASLVNIAIQPIYAGDALHKLVAKNFETAAYVFERCVEEYNKDTKLDHVPDILSGRSVDDKIHQSYHEIVMSDSDIDKLLSAVHWEPSHGNFFMGYPWHMYDDITDYLRYTLYDVIALDLCLRANIQAPKHLRDIFAKEMAMIATECAVVLRTLGNSVKNMKKFASADIMKKAEEAAVALQFKISLHAHKLMGSGDYDSSVPSMHVGSPSYFADRDQRSESYPEKSYSFSGGLQDISTEERKPFNNEYEDVNVDMSPGSSIASPRGIGNGHFDREQKDPSTPLKVGSPGKPPSILDSRKSVTHSKSGITKTKPNTMETLTEGIPAVNVSIPSGGLSRSVSEVEQASELDGRSTPGRIGANKRHGWQETFLHRRSSLGRNWEGTLERISALSLVKFASLLIEVVSKMKYVVDCVEDLSEQAKFSSCDPV